MRDGKLDLTDAAFLPDGDLIVLERHFDFKTGLDIRIRRFPVSAIRPGATVDGTVLFKADLSEQIDNMEGMAVRVTESGETMLTLVSDDNQNRLLQRTILLRLRAGSARAARAAAAPRLNENGAPRAPLRDAMRRRKRSGAGFCRCRRLLGDLALQAAGAQGQLAVLGALARNLSSPPRCSTERSACELISGAP